MSKIRNKAKAILVEWLKGLLNKEEQAKVNVKNVLTLLPNQTHYWHGETFRLEQQLRRKKMIEQGPL